MQPEERKTFTIAWWARDIQRIQQMSWFGLTFLCSQPVALNYQLTL